MGIRANNASAQITQLQSQITALANSSTQIDSEIEAIETRVDAIDTKFEIVLNAETTFYVDEINGLDSPTNTGLTAGLAFKSLKYALSIVKEKYIILDTVTVSVLSDLILTDSANIDLDEGKGTGQLVIDLNNHTITNIGGLFFVKGKSLNSYSLINAVIEGNNTVFYECEGFVIEDCTINGNLIFDSCKSPQVGGITISGSGNQLNFSNCQDPFFGDVILKDSSTILLEGCAGVQTSQSIQIDGNITGFSGGAFLSYQKCSNLKFFGFIQINTSVLRRSLIDVADSSGISLSINIQNLTGATVQLSISSYLMTIANSRVRYEDRSTVADFLDGSGGKAFSLDAFSQLTYTTGNGRRSPLLLPVVSKVNSVNAEAILQGSNFRSTSGLTSTTQATAIDELKSLTNSIEIATITANRQLQNTSARVQDLTNPTSTTRNILLPATPQLAKEFLIINEESSLGNFFVNGSTLVPGDRYAIIWNGAKWLEL